MTDGNSIRNVRLFQVDASRLEGWTQHEWRQWALEYVRRLETMPKRSRLTAHRMIASVLLKLGFNRFEIAHRLKRPKRWMDEVVSHRSKGDREFYLPIREQKYTAAGPTYGAEAQWLFRNIVSLVESRGQEPTAKTISEYEFWPLLDTENPHVFMVGKRFQFSAKQAWRGKRLAEAADVHDEKISRTREMANFLSDLECIADMFDQLGKPIKLRDLQHQERLTSSKRRKK